ncbi:hypothetical protein SAMN05661080_01770 [Modestobacter sp. DSM 44400]|nr:hypothetical protein SAMN05661080_01770 [Modestobacter sp. DSM 44400]
MVATSAQSSRATKPAAPSPAGAAITAPPSSGVAKNGTKSAYIAFRSAVQRRPEAASRSSVAACCLARVEVASGAAPRKEV